MNYLLDTNAFSDLIRGEPNIVARLGAMSAGARVITCAIVVGEILHGLWRLAPSHRQAALDAGARRYFAIVPSQPVPAEAAEHYARIKLARQPQGRPLDENDLWIAATAITFGATWVTRDTDFRNTPGLSTDDWTAP